MIERDYILRMINLLVDVLAKVLLYKKAYEYPQAKREIDGAYKSLLGVGPDFIRQFSDDQLIDLVSKDPNTAGAKCYILGVLIKEDAEIAVAESRTEESKTLDTKALSLLLSAYIDVAAEIEPRHAQLIDEIVGRSPWQTLPAAIQSKLFSYLELTGRFDKAEDVLFALVEGDRSFAAKGFEFYARLLSKTGDELERGNLPRVEVDEGLKQLTKLFSVPHV